MARQGQRGVYDYFRGRVTWPIRDSTGRTLGFGARKLYDDDQIAAKYINTPDTQLYHKNQVLYGIDLAKQAIVKKRQAVIVEGYTDVMAMHLAGVDTAIATCGTAFGEEHAKIVRRLVKDDSLGAIQLVGPLKVDGQPVSSRIVFTFDGDAAGQKAALHAFGLDPAFLSQTFVAVAEHNLDPCDLRIEQGDEAVRALVARAKPLYDFVIGAAINRFDTSYSTGRLGAVKAVAPLIAQIRDRSQVDLYTRQAARRIGGVDLDMMRREVERCRRQLRVRDEDAYAPKRRLVQPQHADGAMTPERVRQIERENARKQTFYHVDDAVFIAEEQFMAVLVQIPNAIRVDWFDSLTPASFETSVFRALFQAVVAAGGLPEATTPQGLWMHNLTKAGGPMLESVINELAVMPLPLADRSANGDDAQGQRVQSDANSPASATKAEVRYASELLARLLDMGFVRSIASARARMSRLPDGEEKIALLGTITNMEASRKSLQNQVHGNNVN